MSNVVPVVQAVDEIQGSTRPMKSGDVMVDATQVAGAVGGMRSAILPKACRIVAFAAPAAADNTGVHAALAGTAAKSFPGPFTNPVIPRNVRCVFAAAYDGGDITINGTDQFDNAISETIVAVANSTVVGSKVFKTVTSAVRSVIGVNGATVSIGNGAKLGLPQKPAADAVVGETILIATATIEATAALDVANASVTTTTAPNGAVNFKFMYNV